MQLSNIPGKLVLPFANAGGKSTIPVASQIGITAGAASLTDGFPPLTRTPIAAGGVPPSGLDMNGILYEMSAIIRWANAGGGYPYDGTFATDTNVGGYPKGARIMRSDGTGYWFNTVENNVTDPEVAGAAAAGWVPDYQSGAAAVAMSGSSVTLTPNQYGKPLIVVTGTLSANLNLIFPALAQGWTVINNATGSYSITAKTASGSGVTLGTISQIVGDGTNIYQANPDCVQIVNNVSTLRNIAPSLSRRIQTKGYYSDGDGGKGQYYAKVGAAPGTYVDNSGSIIVPNGGDGSSAWFLDFTNFINVKQFGAKGDGITDDHLAIQSAIDSLIGKGGKVYFLQGRYYLASPVVLQTTHEAVTIAGPSAGRGAVAVQAVQLVALTCAIKTATTGTTRPGIDGQLYGFDMYDMLVMSSTATHDHLLQLNGIYTGNFVNILLSGVTIGKDNFQLSNAVDVNIDNLQIAGCGRYGVNIGDAIATNSSTTIRFRGGYLRNCRDAGIWGIGADQMSTLIIDGTIVESSGRDGAGAPISGAIGAGVVVENTTGLEINAYFEGNLSADIVLGGTISSTGVVTKGVQCKDTYVDGYFYASTGVGANCKYGTLLINADNAEINGHYSSHSVAEIDINATLITDVTNVNFNRITYGSVPSGSIGDNWNRIDPLVLQNNLRIGNAKAVGSTAIGGGGVFPAQFDGNGTRLPGNTSTSGMNTGDGFQFFNSTYSSIGEYVTDGYYYQQNPRTIVYAATAHSGNLNLGYGKFILRPNGAGQSVTIPLGLYSGQQITIANASSTNSIGIVGGFSTVTIPAGKAVDFIYDGSSGAWLSKSI